MARRLVFAYLVSLLIGLPAFAGLAAGQTTTTAPPPDKIDQLITLLADPAVKGWLADQLKQPAAEAQTVQAAPAAGESMQQSMVSSTLDHISRHVQMLIEAWPLLPDRLEEMASRMKAESADRGSGRIGRIVLGFVGVGIALSYLVYRLSRPLRIWTIAQPRNTPRGRARRVGARLLVALLLIGSFVLGSAGTFLLFNWPPLLREIVLAYLTAAIGIWIIRMLARVLLLPPRMGVQNAVEVRVVPLSDDSAAHWYRWLVWIGAVVCLVGASFSLLRSFGFDQISLLALAVPLDLLLLALVLAAVWTRPAAPWAEPGARARIGHVATSWLWTAYLISLFLIRTSGAHILFWFVVAAVALPGAIVIAHRAVKYVLRPPEGDDAGQPIAPVTIAVIDRGIRMIFIVCAAYLLAKVWGLDMQAMDAKSPLLTLLLRGLLNAAVIALAADFGWSMVKAIIERRLGVTQAGVDEHGVMDPQQARIRTLLPIIQNIMFAAIMIVAVLMILSSIGVQVGPLIAGAGVVGVAIGFGAQTLVKDVIAGIFYLLDDAFRVGEYISSGKYMGTVESFSLRSVKLRHHRGPLFTIPFGELGAVQNQSRDWVTDKFNITVGYDTDLEAARKLIKKIGLELAEDPEFAPYVIEPIKMQGVQAFGDYGIVLRMKATTKPGQAFGMKRKFYVRVQKAFKDAGIDLPFPTVHVEQGQPVAAAVSQNHLDAQRKQAEARAAEDGEA